MTSMTRKTRRDGKARRTPRLGTPPTRIGITGAPADETAPSWHELVQPGPAGNPARTRDRREQRGQTVRLTHAPAAVPAVPAQQGGPVRLGRFRSPHLAIKTGEPLPSIRTRVIKGHRRPGLVEVEVGHARERMAAIRQRPINRETTR